MKFVFKNFTLHHYVRYMRRQSKHVQHLHAMVFAGMVTSLIAGFILYTDYGFWHETYRRAPDEGVPIGAEPVPLGESFGKFLVEAKEKFGAIGNAGAGLLEGKEIYQR
jgi:hypothetical protein